MIAGKSDEFSSSSVMAGVWVPVWPHSTAMSTAKTPMVPESPTGCALGSTGKDGNKIKNV